MYDDETPHEISNRLKKLVNKERALGSKKWTDCMLTKRLMMAYTPMKYNVVALIRQDPAYKKMLFDDVLKRIMNHEINIQEVNNINNLYKDVSSSKKQDIAFKATNKNKKRKAIVESPSEEEEDEDEKEYVEDEVTLFIKKFIKKRRPYKRDRREKPRLERARYNCGKNGHFIAQCPHERKEEDNEKKMKLDKRYKKNNKFTKISPMVKLKLVNNRTQVMRVPSQKVIMWQPLPSRSMLH
jgi:hypothetical protein